MDHSAAQEKRNHSLLIGATGMLEDASIKLSEESLSVSVVAQTEESLSNLGKHISRKNFSVNYNPIKIDYRNVEGFKKAITDAISRYGRIDLVVAWIHSDAPEAPVVAAQLVANEKDPIDYFHIRGTSQNSISAKQVDEALQSINGIRYHRIDLGVKSGTFGSRWLTNKEISDGVFKAIETGSIKFVVGQIGEP